MYAVMALLLFPKQVLGLFKLEMNPLITKIVEKKMLVLGGVMLLNMYVQNQLLTTGKMGVFVDKVNVFDGAKPIDEGAVLSKIAEALIIKNR